MMGNCPQWHPKKNKLLYHWPNDDDKDISNHIDDTPLFSSRLPPMIDEGNLEESYRQNDHGEGI